MHPLSTGRHLKHHRTWKPATDRSPRRAVEWKFTLFLAAGWSDSYKIRARLLFAVGLWFTNTVDPGPFCPLKRKSALVRSVPYLSGPVLPKGRTSKPGMTPLRLFRALRLFSPLTHERRNPDSVLGVLGSAFKRTPPTALAGPQRAGDARVDDRRPRMPLDPQYRWRERRLCVCAGRPPLVSLLRAVTLVSDTKNTSDNNTECGNRKPSPRLNRAGIAIMLSKVTETSVDIGTIVQLANAESLM